MHRVAESSSGHRRGISIGATLILLILSILVPILVAEIFIYSDRFERRVRDEHNANLEMARVFGKSFERLIQDILREESSIAVFLTSRLPTSSREAQKILEDSSKNYDFILDFNWVNPQGRIEASSSPNFVGVDLSDRSFFREMVSGSDWVVSDLMQSKRTGEPIFVIGRAIRNAERTLLGYVIARIVPDRLDPFLGFERFEHGTVCLLDSRGVLVYSYPNVHATWEERHWVESRFSSVDDTEARITARAPIRSIGWSASASRQAEDVTRPITRHLVWNGSVLLFVVFSSLGFALILSRSISSPIKKLQAYTLSIAKGDITKQPGASGPSEIRDLTRVFIEAEKTLRESEENLKNQLQEQQRADEALRESEERHRSIFENSMDGIILSFPDGRILAANPEACRMHGYTEAEMRRLGRGGITDKGDPRLQKLVDERSRTGRYRGEVTHIRRDGTRFPCETSTALFKDKHGLESSVVMIRDITERKQAEEELRRAKDELELRVRERTAELERSNSELQDFVFIASHDLKEPLRKIQVFGDLVVTRAGASLDEQSIDHLCRMQEAAARMQVLLESLLAYSRVTTKAKPFTPVNLAEAARNAVSNLEVVFRQTGASVEIADLPVFEGDHSQFVQLFQNLFGNALKFRREEEAVRLKIYSRSMESERSGAGENQIHVEDNGIGFDEKYLDKIFMPFQRLHGTNDYEGVGMGLAICRKIVERHCGTITARSIPGKGSTFIVKLPARHSLKEMDSRLRGNDSNKA